MQNKNILYIILTLIFIALSIGILTYVLTNRDKATGSEIDEVNSSNLETISQKSGTIEITATPKLTDSRYEFDITLDTHSIELNYDLISLSSLTNENGQTVKPSGWKGDKPGGHHRKGKLFFPSFPGKPKVLNLSINGIEGEDVNFKWELKN